MLCKQNQPPFLPSFLPDFGVYKETILYFCFYKNIFKNTICCMCLVIKHFIENKLYIMEGAL